MSTVIGFAAQCEGRDAHQAIGPYFWALKRAAGGVDVPGFPLPKLSFLLRVDGSLRSFGFEGPAHVDVDAAGTYVSVDIGITIPARARLLSTTGDNPIVQGILAAVPLLASTRHKHLDGADFVALEACLRSLCDRYLADIAGN